MIPIKLKKSDDANWPFLIRVRAAGRPQYGSVAWSDFPKIDPLPVVFQAWRMLYLECVAAMKKT